MTASGLNIRKLAAGALALAVLYGIGAVRCSAAVRVITAPDASPREQYAAEQLRTTLTKTNQQQNVTILVAQRNSKLFRNADALPQFWPGATEAFALRRVGNTIYVAGSDASGVLYGAMELQQRIASTHALPTTLDYEDHPALKLRGTAIGLQKPEITYEGAEYDYPYTPKDFPFFYDKAAWTRYLDMLLRERMNTLYLWNGHPFTSLLKLPRYPEAQELPTAQLEQNIAMYRWITREADRRGIWVLQGFYNIHLSHTFARAHNLPYHLTTPTPLATEYTRYAISEFIREYPNVGLMMTLGEALSPHAGAQWLTQAIIPGVQDGLHTLGTTSPPPIVVRAHATDIDDVLKAANPMYSNIDTMFKWNGESLTWTNVRGPVLDRFKDLVANSNIAIANIHLLSNLEPFRWGDPDFVRQTLLNFQRIGIQGLHLYPLRYWDWPNTADNPALNQLDRDWIWFDAWSRYAWNPNRDPMSEHTYWVQQLAERYGSTAAGEHLLAAYELSGVCAPEMLPRIGITEGNREVFSLGLTMPQLIDAARYNPAQTLWTGDAPDGERLDDYVAAEIAHKPHHGKTPLAVADSAAEESGKAVVEAEAARADVTKDLAEYDRLLNDMRCIHALMLFYQAKTHAAELVMLYGYDHDIAHLQQAEPLLAESVADFRTLTQLTDTTYRDAASMHTSQRQIPLRGGPKTEHWRDLLPVYEKELATYRARLKLVTSGVGNAHATDVKTWPQLAFTISPGAAETFVLRSGERVSVDSSVTITGVAQEMSGFTGIRAPARQDVPLRFTLQQPGQVLVGFFKTKGRTGPANSDAENWNLLLLNAITLNKGQPLDVWAAPFGAGTNELNLSSGSYVVLGFIPQDLKTQQRVVFDAGANSSAPANLDWMFEN